MTPVERDLVIYAAEELRGSFPIERLYRKFKGVISRRQLAKLGRRWESNGWLSPPASVVEARQVTDKLQKMVLDSD